MKQKIVIDDVQNIYTQTFNDFIDRYKPLRDEEDKKYIKIYKYPIIFAILPTIMKREYPHLSKASVQIYSTRLGLSRFDHDEKVKSKKIRYENAMYNTTLNNIGIVDLLRHRITYNYMTQTSNNKCIYLSTTEDVKSYISEYGDCFGVPDYQFALGLFFLGIQDANLKECHKFLVNQELDLFWKILEINGKKY